MASKNEQPLWIARFFRCPCRECKKRHVGCHDRCGEYQAYRKQVDEAKEAARVHYGGGNKHNIQIGDGKRG